MELPGPARSAGPPDRPARGASRPRPRGAAGAPRRDAAARVALRPARARCRGDRLADRRPHRAGGRAARARGVGHGEPDRRGAADPRGGLLRAARQPGRQCGQRQPARRDALRDGAGQLDQLGQRRHRADEPVPGRGVAQLRPVDADRPAGHRPGEGDAVDRGRPGPGGPRRRAGALGDHRHRRPDQPPRAERHDRGGQRRRRRTGLRGRRQRGQGAGPTDRGGHRRDPRPHRGHPELDRRCGRGDRAHLEHDRGDGGQHAVHRLGGRAADGDVQRHRAQRRLGRGADRRDRGGAPQRPPSPRARWPATSRTW